MIPECALYCPAAVEQLGTYNISGNLKAFVLIIRIPVLLASQQNISIDLALDACEKSAAAAHKHKLYPV